MKLGLDVTNTSKELAKHCLPVTAETRLDATHSLSCFPVNLHCTVSMGTKGLECKTQKYKKTHNDLNEILYTLLKPAWTTDNRKNEKKKCLAAIHSFASDWRVIKNQLPLLSVTTITITVTYSSFLCLKLFFSLKAILFDLRLSFFFRLFQTPVLTCRGHISFHNTAKCLQELPINYFSLCADNELKFFPE